MYGKPGTAFRSQVEKLSTAMQQQIEAVIIQLYHRSAKVTGMQHAGMRKLFVPEFTRICFGISVI